MTVIIRRPYDPPPPIPDSDQPVIPGSDTPPFRGMVLVQPFLDPVNTFRAQSVEDMFFITPERTKFSRFEFDVGLDPKIEPFTFSIQNRTLNASLRVKLTLPSYLRSSLGDDFIVPPFGDTITPPVAFRTRAERQGRIRPRLAGLTILAPIEDPDSLDFVGAGKGLVNVTITFSEEQAKTFNPGILEDAITFDIFHNAELTGPVFVSTTVEPPRDLNLIDIPEDQDIPVDDDVTDPAEPEVITITETVEVPVEVPVVTPAFIAGVDGITDNRVQFRAGDTVEGPPPTGWITEADGRAYPPIEPEEVCDPTGVNGDDDGVVTITPPTIALTGLQQVLKDAENVPASFGSATRRRGFIVDADGQLTGDSPGRVSRRTVAHIAADSVPGTTQFAIVGRSPTFIDGTAVEADDRTGDYFDTVNLIVSLVKEDQTVPFSFDQTRNFALSRIVKDRFADNDDLTVPRDLGDAELQTFRIAATALGLLRGLRDLGAGVPV